jgi:hypothetical protein
MPHFDLVLAHKQRGTGTGFYASNLFFFCRQYHPTNAPYSSPSTRCCFQNDKVAKPGNFPKINALSETQ